LYLEALRCSASCLLRRLALLILDKRSALLPMMERLVVYLKPAGLSWLVTPLRATEPVPSDRG
jgi:hypothetical protein